MNKFIIKNSSTKNILFLFLLFLIFNLFLFPNFLSHAKPLDLQFSYSGAEAYALIGGYG
jgi:hypothetical protein